MLTMIIDLLRYDNHDKAIFIIVIKVNFQIQVPCIAKTTEFVNANKEMPH